MKKNFKMLLMVMLTFIFSICFKLQVNAVIYPAYGQYKLTWNIESIYYYVDSSAENYSSVISSAANNWVYTGLGYNKLWPNTRIYDVLGTAIDIYAYNGNVNGIEATTSLYKWVNSVKTEVPWVGVSGRSNTGIPSGDYKFAEILINSSQISSNSSYYTNTRFQGIVAHEFGHCWGIGHNPENVNSLMHNYSDNRSNTVQQVDQNVFNILYP